MPWARGPQDRPQSCFFVPPPIPIRSVPRRFRGVDLVRSRAFWRNPPRRPGRLFARKRRSPRFASRTERLRALSSKTAKKLRSEEHTSELQSRLHLVCRLLLVKKKKMLIPNVRSSTLAVNLLVTIIQLNALHTNIQNLFRVLDAVMHMLMESKHCSLMERINVA